MPFYRGAPRVRLVDLEPYLHDSVIGVCVADDVLRDIVVAFDVEDCSEASSFELHAVAVQLAGKRVFKAVVTGRCVEHHTPMLTIYRDW